MNDIVESLFKIVCYIKSIDLLFDRQDKILTHQMLIDQLSTNKNDKD